MRSLTFTLGSTSCVNAGSGDKFVPWEPRWREVRAVGIVRADITDPLALPPEPLEPLVLVPVPDPEEVEMLANDGAGREEGLGYARRLLS